MFGHGDRRIRPKGSWLAGRANVTEAFDQGLEIPFINDLDVRSGIKLTHPAQFFVLLGHITLVHGGQFQVGVELDEVKIGAESQGDIAFGVPFDRKRPWFIFPLDLVHVQDAGELGFGFVFKMDLSIRSLNWLF